MSNIAIEFENVGKMYRLGRVGTGTLSHDLNRWWQTTILHHEDPYLKIGQTNDRSHKGSSDYVWALKDIKFKVEQGDVVGIIGKNGAGKSTLLKLLSNITSPTTGFIKYKGRIASLLEVGTGFHPELTGRENIYMNGSIMGMTKAEITRKLDEIVYFAGVERYLDTPVKRYSSGMTVRLGFAVAAFLEPEILVVDEVLTVGDAEFQKKAIGKMNDVSKEGGRTVLFVSHNMAAVRTLCTRGVVLENGMQIFDGNVNEAVDYYIGSCQQIKHNKNFNSQERQNKRVYISDFEIVDSKEAPLDFVSFNDRVRFKMKVKANESASFTARIAIFDLNEARVMAFDTQDIMQTFKIESKQEKTIYCQVQDKLSIKPGRYKINLSIRQGSDLLDHVTNATFMDVAEEDFFGFGRISVSDMPICLRHYEWTER